MSSARAELCWEKGVELDVVLNRLESYMASVGLELGVKCGETYTFSWRRQGKTILECVQRPWEVQSLLDASFRNLTWSFCSPVESTWFRCCIYSAPEEGLTCLAGEQVVRLMINFDEEPNSWTLTPEEAKRAVSKYSQLRELHTHLGCDVVNGFSDSHYSGGTAFNQDPEHLQKIFRFAKKGRNVFIVPMEEGRARRVGELDWRRVDDCN